MSISEEQLKKMIASISNNPVENIKSETRLRDDLRMDSLQSLDLMVTLEEEHDIIIPQVEAINIQTYQQLVDFISKLTA